MSAELDQLVEEINHAGWLISGLHQIDNAHWMASVRKKWHFSSGYGQGRDPVEAVREAWEKRKKPERDRMAVQEPTCEPPWKPARERIPTKRVRI